MHMNPTLFLHKVTAQTLSKACATPLDSSTVHAPPVKGRGRRLRPVRRGVLNTASRTCLLVASMPWVTLDAAARAPLTGLAAAPTRPCVGWNMGHRAHVGSRAMGQLDSAWRSDSMQTCAA